VTGASHTRIGVDRAWGGMLNGAMFVLLGGLMCIGLPALFLLRLLHQSGAPSIDNLPAGTTAVLAFGYGGMITRKGLLMIGQHLAALRERAGSRSGD
jgi:hypothetical protein